MDVDINPIAEHSAMIAKKYALEEIRLFAQRLERNEAISIHPDALKAIIDEYDSTKDAILPQPERTKWTSRIAEKGNGHAHH